MSLHRVASMESWERPRGASRASSPAANEHRKMSFNPIDDWLPPAPVKAPQTAIEVSTAKRIVQVAIACVYCLLAAGVVFGFAAFKPVLVSEGVYQQYCSDDDSSDENFTCYEQEIRLNLMFTTAAVVTNVVALPVGTVLDRYGPCVCGIIGSFCLVVGSIFIIVAPQAPFDGYLPGYVFLALGGPFIFISSFQLSNCFPRNSGLILALLTGAFDTSSAVLLAYRLIYTASNRTFSPQNFFTLYLIVPLFILLAQFFVMPKQSYKTIGELVDTVGESNHNEIADNEHLDTGIREDARRNQREARRNSVLSEMSPLLGKKDHDKAIQEEERKKRVSGVWGALHGLSAFQQITTPWWTLIAFFVMIQMTRINYFVATIRTQYDYMLGSYEQAVHVNNVFDVALPAGGVVAIPFIGFILDNLSTTTALSVLVGTATLIGILGTLPFMWAAYLNVLLFVLYRPLYYTAVSDYAAKVFGFHTFGKVYGLIICASGLFNFSQSALDALTHHAFGGDPLLANLILLFLALVVGVILVAYVYRKSVYLAGEFLEEEAEDAVEALVPGSDGAAVEAEVARASLVPSGDRRRTRSQSPAIVVEDTDRNAAAQEIGFSTAPLVSQT